MTPFHTGLMASLIVATSTLPAIAAEQKFDLHDFDSIKLEKGIILNVILGEKHSVTAETSSRRLMRRMDITKSGKTLKISRESGWSFFMMGLTDSYHVTVTMPSLAGLDVSSGAEAAIDGQGATLGDMSLSASSGSSIFFEDLAAKALSVKMSSGANVDLGGTCAEISVKASSGSDLDGEDLTCARADLRVSSGADIELGVTDWLEGRVSSGGHIEVYGTPEQAQIRESSGGALRVSN